MILDDKKRVIGKIVSINSDRFTVELLSGIKNFNVSGYDDIHYFAQINSYVIVPYQDRYIVSEVVGVREKDTPDFTNAKEQELNKLYSVKYLDVLPIGTIKDKKFDFGVSVYPTLYSDVLYIKDTELDVLFEVHDAEVFKCTDCEKEGDECKEHKDTRKGKTRTKSFDVGESAIFPDYKIKIDVDRFFGSHAAVLGNTGSGKSCTISSMLQTIFSKETEFFAIGSTFVIFDVNGEYKQAFNSLDKGKINVSNFSIEKDDQHTKFQLPHYFLNIDEWELLLQASEKTQRPILRTALALATLFSKKDNEEIKKIKNHILATCITSILRDETGSPSKKDRILSILRKFNTEDIKLDKSFKYTDKSGVEQENLSYDRTTLPCTIENSLFVHFGGIIGTGALHCYLEHTDTEGNQAFFDKNFQMPNYDKDTPFEFDELENALDLAILYEEAYGNKHIRDYCSSLITRLKNIRDRQDFKFIKEKYEGNTDQYLSEILGLESKKKVSQITILNLDLIDDELVELVSSVIARLIFDKLKNIKKRNSFPVNLILEEAHRYISHEPKRNFIRANEVFERVSKEGRKYGLFLLVSSQRPSELSRTVLSQCNNFIVHRIQNPDDLSHIRQITPHISEATLKKLPSIPTQHALIFGSAVNIPTLYKVKKAWPLPLSDNNRVSDNWFVDKDQEFDI